MRGRVLVAMTMGKGIENGEQRSDGLVSAGKDGLLLLLLLLLLHLAGCGRGWQGMMTRFVGLPASSGAS